MKSTPKALRLQIGLFGRTNVGKSSFLNMIAGQDVSITSEKPGTTTDVVEKTMELLPIGPVVFLDTGGLDDASDIGHLRVQKAKKIFDRADVVLLIAEPGVWGDFEDRVIAEAHLRETPVVAVINKIDLQEPDRDSVADLKCHAEQVVLCSSVDPLRRDEYVNRLKQALIAVCPGDFLKPPALIGDLLPPGGLAVLIVPIDLQAPKGRLILPQVQTLRDALDNDAACLVVKEREYAGLLQRLNEAPDLVVCDSQAVMKMAADTPPEIPCTTFSILFSRYKGDLLEMVRGAAVIDRLKPGDRVLIAEACSHHAIEDDIGRVKIPRWLKQYTGTGVQIDTCAGRDYPQDLKKYQLIIHCGSCMLTRKEMLLRIQKARDAGVPITNYGVCISLLQGVLKRALSPFPAALDLLG
ncbi:MAG: [FeFe] hydrogenase H-cluster maturation GTPase HydF [Candidatus Omnitrophota bacterium]